MAKKTKTDPMISPEGFADDVYEYHWIHKDNRASEDGPEEDRVGDWILCSKEIEL